MTSTDYSGVLPQEADYSVEEVLRFVEPTVSIFEFSDEYGMEAYSVLEKQGLVRNFGVKSVGLAEKGEEVLESSRKEDRDLTHIMEEALRESQESPVFVEGEQQCREVSREAGEDEEGLGYAPEDPSKDTGTDI